MKDHMWTSLAFAAVILSSQAPTCLVGSYVVETPAEHRCYDDVIDEIINHGIDVAGMSMHGVGSFRVPPAQLALARKLVEKIERREGIWLRSSDWPLRGDTFITDPSRLVRTADGYWIMFCSGPRLSSRYSSDLLTWRVRNSIMDHIPQWARGIVPQGDDYAWAPDIIFDKPLGKWVLFYGYSENGINRSILQQNGFGTLDIGNSVIGALTTPTLKIDSNWIDSGEVLASTKADDYNALDPCPIWDTAGRLWLSYGLAKRGIMVTEMDPLKLKPVGKSVCIASGLLPDMSGSFIWHRGNYYYLFYNRGNGYRHLYSTYKICVARSRSITGPYLDKAGIRCDRGGDSVLLESRDTMIGPAQVGISDGSNVFSIYFEDAAGDGIDRLAWGRIRIDKAGWPVLGPFRW